MGASKQILIDQMEKEREREVAECIRCGERFDPLPGVTDELEHAQLLAMSAEERALLGFDRNCCDYCEHVASKDD